MNTIRVVGDLSYDTSKKLGEGSFGTLVFSGFLKNGRAVAVKRMQKYYLHHELDTLKWEVELMNAASDHPNILRCIFTTMNEDYMFIAMELCSGTLIDYFNGKYEGPKFRNEKEILRQVTRGLNHLHNLRIVHRDLQPTNLLIFVPTDESNKPKMKLADFSISKMINSDFDSDFTNTSPTNPSGSRGWMAPEVYESKRFDLKVDVWALGLIFGYTLSGGRHPFGEDPDRRIVLIKDKKPMLLAQHDLKQPYSNNHVAFDLIKSILRIEPCQRPTAGEVLNNEFFIHNLLGKEKNKLPDDAAMVKLGKNTEKTRIRNDGRMKSTGINEDDLIAIPPMPAGSGSSPPPTKVARVGEKLSYNPQKKIGRGSISIIFEGHYEERKGEKRSVAIKRFQTSDIDDVVDLQEVKLMMTAKDHPNILRCFHTERTDNFVFMAMELCKGTLEHIINGTYDGPTIGDRREIIYQVSKGLAHLHRNKIIHRDIKPNNILVYIPERGQPLMKLADFGLSKVLNMAKDDFTNTNVGNPSGTRGWMAPELYQSSRYDSKVDIFALGCIFGYTLSNGKHPFGDDPFDRNYRVKHMMPIVMIQEDLTIPYSEDGVAYQLILSMVEMEPVKRPPVEEVLRNPFFLPCLK